MMRIVCPNCGEEPQKGQRHVCREGAERERALPGLQAESVRRRTVPCATAGSMCASIASLASKNPVLWKSKRRLARCGGEEFVAGLIFMAAGLPSWSRDPKRTLVGAFWTVATEAAKVLQGFWRQTARSVDKAARQSGATEHDPTKTSTHCGFHGLPLAQRDRTSGVRSESEAPTSSPLTRKVSADTASQPLQPAVLRKSNPRPTQSRAVPLNPLQALKQRAQQQQEVEERRLQRRPAEQARQTREPDGKAPLGQGSQMSSSQHSFQSEDIDRRRSASPWQRFEALPVALPAPSQSQDREVPEMQDSTTDSTPKPDGPSEFAGLAGEHMPTPLERRQLRQEAELAAPPSPRKALDPFGGYGQATLPSVAATERLRDRLRKREGSGGKSDRTPRPLPEAGAAQVHWKERIEMRHKETEVQQVQEQEEKLRTAERSTKRNDAMRRVMERREQRLQEA
ncbi:unnamed protein product [Effrenium voratum]|uniref:Uncharacterized protein n=1 Tax=Effrenium voratum TaxID=2562239 RepID=A0AA36JMV8_9DINO|nr:unnamed protein product [Effrenium voratum]CAJ1460121.1 unnamed protein product [Effrenium voratum]